MCQIVSLFFGKYKTSKRRSEINWPLDDNSMLHSDSRHTWLNTFSRHFPQRNQFDWFYNSFQQLWNLNGSRHVCFVVESYDSGATLPKKSQQTSESNFSSIWLFELWMTLHILCRLDNSEYFHSNSLYENPRSTLWNLLKRDGKFVLGKQCAIRSKLDLYNWLYGSFNHSIIWPDLEFKFKKSFKRKE